MVRHSEAGYTLLILMVFISVLLIGLLVAMPVLETQSRREKEEELQFRGRQYVEAVRLFVQNNPGNFPKSIKDLVKNRYLRKAFPEPMTKEGKWNLVLLADSGPSGASAGGESSGEIRRAGQAAQTRGGRTNPSAAAGGASIQRVLVVPEESLSSIDNPRIIGIVSPSPRKSFYIFDENDTYDTWLFYYGRTPGAKPEIVMFGDPQK